MHRNLFHTEFFRSQPSRMTYDENQIFVGHKRLAKAEFPDTGSHSIHGLFILSWITVVWFDAVDVE
jgi:hypothetical protein